METTQASFPSGFLTGAITAIGVKMAIYPNERVKLLYVLSHLKESMYGGKAFKGRMDCLTQTVKFKGLFGLWQESANIVLLYSAHHAFNFGFKEQFGKWFSNRDSSSMMKLLTVNMISGSMAGLATLCIEHPVMLARLAHSRQFGVRKPIQLRNLKNYIIQRFIDKRPLKLYKGIWTYVPHIFVYRGAYFGLYDAGFAYFYGSQKNTNFIKLWLLALLTTSIATLISHPLASVRSLLLMELKYPDKKYKGTIDCIINLFKKGHQRALIIGWQPALFSCTSSALLLACYSKLPLLTP
ncbi:unnamed protein product [Moneuplotes crassus]|uniref:ADP/ATP translocase n=1 Tax=Euplotes crassus TaxID=5936 RepID=A0AAD1XQI7_EUPCR|nr:unnamed protein product [Moneuplotes crassus]